MCCAGVVQVLKFQPRAETVSVYMRRVLIGETGRTGFRRAAGCGCGMGLGFFGLTEGKGGGEY